MTGNEILRADMLDILFDNRNKDYGAYRLRKFYNNRLILSLAIALSSILLLFFFVGSVNNKSVVQSDKSVVVKDVVIRPAEKKIEIPQPKPKQTVASKTPSAPSRKFVNRVEIIRDDEMKKQDNIRDIDKFMISDITKAGVPGGPKVPQVISTATGDGTKSQPATTDAALINSDPEFPGGVKAWLNFLNRNLRVPDDLEPGEKKTVLIRFEVATDGSVTGFQVVQSGGNFYDNEVIRVLKKMPKWKPAMQSSVPVSVAFTQPVTFMGVTE